MQSDFRAIVGKKIELPSLDVLDRPQDYFDQFEEIDPAQLEVLQNILLKGDDLNKEAALINKPDVKRHGLSPQERH